jgi:3-hydroxy-3-methylglutaryl CoA synthase
MVDCIERYGNTSAASIPLALAEAEASGTLVDGSRLLLAAFGAGFTWGGVVVDWGLDGAKRRSAGRRTTHQKEVHDEHHNGL